MVDLFFSKYQTSQFSTPQARKKVADRHATNLVAFRLVFPSREPFYSCKRHHSLSELHFSTTERPVGLVDLVIVLVFFLQSEMPT